MKTHDEYWSSVKRETTQAPSFAASGEDWNQADACNKGEDEWERKWVKDNAYPDGRYGGAIVSSRGPCQCHTIELLRGRTRQACHIPFLYVKIIEPECGVNRGPGGTISK